MSRSTSGRSATGLRSPDGDDGMSSRWYPRVSIGRSCQAGKRARSRAFGSWPTPAQQWSSAGHGWTSVGRCAAAPSDTIDRRRSTFANTPKDFTEAAASWNRRTVRRPPLTGDRAGRRRPGKAAVPSEVRSYPTNTRLMSMTSTSRALLSSASSTMTESPSIPFTRAVAADEIRSRADGWSGRPASRGRPPRSRRSCQWTRR
jgi:hypothetical protein